MEILEEKSSQSKLVQIQITRFEGFDDCKGIIYDGLLLDERKKICDEIGIYCRNNPAEMDFTPEIGEVIFARIPAFTDINNTMAYEYRNDPEKKTKWLQEERKQLNPNLDSEYDHAWTRATFVSEVTLSTPEHRSNAFFVDLNDFGRRVPVARCYIRRAVQSFLTHTYFSWKLCILIHGAQQYNSVLDLKWKRIIPAGTFLLCKMITSMGDMLVLNLVDPSERKCEEFYKETFAGDITDDSQYIFNDEELFSLQLPYPPAPGSLHIHTSRVYSEFESVAGNMPNWVNEVKDELDWSDEDG